jgi:hypothetical protein
MKPRARISHFRGEVKDNCNSITAATMLAMASPMEVSRYVREQLSNYNYTFPRGPRVGVAALYLLI